MNIKFKNYVITYDRLNYVLNRVVVRGEKAKKENQGKESLKALKYYSTLNSAVSSAYYHLIADGVEDTQSIEDALKAMDAITNDFKKFLAGLDLKND